ncbi:hypothetical protein KBI23_16455 [bacterium]|nr:hypothetical protein [bacterium]MBP9806827.1 hypothetical protein [bacterium]
MHYTCRMNQPKGNPSRLSKEQVIWLNCLILALLVGRLGLGGYYFANEQLENFATAIWALMLVFVAVVISMGPKSIVRTISLVLAIPIAMLASLGAYVDAASSPENPDRIELAAQVGDVTFELVSKYDVTYYEICKRWLELNMRRPVLNGILEQQERLISVQPAFGATAELIDNGKNIQFSSPALLGRKAILRTYSTDWNEAKKHGHEHIQLTPVEQKATGIQLALWPLQPAQ